MWRALHGTTCRQLDVLYHAGRANQSWGSSNHRVSIRSGHNNARSRPAWRSMVDDPPGPQRRYPPRRVREPFLPPSWYRVVSHGVSGLQNEILSSDHDVSRHVPSCLRLPLLPLSSPSYYDVSMLSSLSYSTLLQLIVVGTKRSSPEADPTPMHEKPTLANVITDDSPATA